MLCVNGILKVGQIGELIQIRQLIWLSGLNRLSRLIRLQGLIWLPGFDSTTILVWSSHLDILIMNLRWSCRWSIFHLLCQWSIKSWSNRIIDSNWIIDLTIKIDSTIRIELLLWVDSNPRIWLDYHLGLVKSFGYFDDEIPLVVSVECFTLVVSMEYWKLVESENWFESDNLFDYPDWFESQDWIDSQDWLNSPDWFDFQDWFDWSLDLVESFEYLVESQIYFFELKSIHIFELRVFDPPLACQFGST